MVIRLWAASNLQSDAFLLVYDTTNPDSLAGLSWFLDMISVEAENRMEENNRLLREKGTQVKGKWEEGWKVPPVTIVVGNTCGFKDAPLAPAKRGWEWARRRGCGCMESSAREMVNIEETFAWIVRRVVDNRRSELGLSSARSKGHPPQTRGAGLSAYSIPSQISAGQPAIVPASALYGPNAVRAPIAGADGSQGQNWQHAPSTMLYGAHGQPLGPAGPGGQPQYSHPAPAQHPPSQTYPPGPYPRLPPPSYGSAPLPPVSTPGPQYDQQPQAPPTASSDRSDRGSLKRRPPDDDSHNESSRTAHFLHLTTKPCHSYEGRTSGSFEYANGPASPATPTLSYQLYPPTTIAMGLSP